MSLDTYHYYIKSYITLSMHYINYHCYIVSFSLESKLIRIL